jgi:undecaprenyl-diphosphatase
VVVPWLLGWPEHGLSFDVALHVGTLAAVLYAFFDDWRLLLSAGVRGIVSGRPFADPDSRLLWLLAAASVPGPWPGSCWKTAPSRPSVPRRWWPRPWP